MKTLEKSLKILEEVARSAEPVGVRDLARTVSINTTTVHKILATLEASGYLRNTDGKYSLGIKSFLLGTREEYHRTLLRFCLPFMEQLRDALGHTVALTVRAVDDIVSLGVCTPKSGLAVISEPGAVVHAHTMASGKVILADMDTSERDAYLKRHPLVKVTGCSITSRTQLNKALRRVKETGIAVVRDEEQEGVSALAVGIRNDADECIAVLGIKLPSLLMESKTEQRLRDALRNAVNDVESKL